MELTNGRENENVPATGTFSSNRSKEKFKGNLLRRNEMTTYREAYALNQSVIDHVDDEISFTLPA
jgi:hypothetical protein